MAVHNEISRYLRYMKNEVGVTDNTLIAYRGDLAQFQEYLIKNGVDENGLIEYAVLYSYRHVDNYLQFLILEGYSLSTVKRRVAVLNGFFAFFDIDLVVSNFVKKHIIKETLVRNNTFIPEEEFEKIVECCVAEESIIAMRDVAIMEILWGTGMHITQLILLDLHSIRLFGGNVFVHFVDNMNKDIVTPIDGRVINALEKYLNQNRSFLARDGISGFALFLSQRGRRLTRHSILMIVKNRASKAGVENVTPKVLRNSYKHNFCFEKTIKK